MADERENLRELVVLAQKGDQNAFSLLLKAYDPLITSMVTKFRVDGMSDADEEDLRQEAVLAFTARWSHTTPVFREWSSGCTPRCVFATALYLR